MIIERWGFLGLGVYLETPSPGMGSQKRRAFHTHSIAEFGRNHALRHWLFGGARPRPLGQMMNGCRVTSRRCGDGSRRTFTGGGIVRPIPRSGGKTGNGKTLCRSRPSRRSHQLSLCMAKVNGTWYRKSPGRSYSNSRNRPSETDIQTRIKVHRCARSTRMILMSLLARIPPRILYEF